MNNGELKKLEDNLWDAANSLRAYGGIKASDYAVPEYSRAIRTPIPRESGQ